MAGNHSTLRPPATPRPAAGRRRARGGFTLVELLIVIGIALLLIGILFPAINRAFRAGARTKMAFDVQALVTALEAYKKDHGDIPRTSPTGLDPVRVGTAAGPLMNGAQVLCRAMIGLGPATIATAETGVIDGADGPGFRTVPPIGGTAQGKVYGPYIAPDKLKVVAYPGGGTPVVDFRDAVLADSNGLPILYYPGRKVDIYGPSSFYVRYAQHTDPAIRPMFNVRDNDPSASNAPASPDLQMTEKKLQLLMGDSALAAVAPNAPLALKSPGTVAQNGRIDRTEGEEPAFVGDYLIVSPGPDERFGPKDETLPISSKNPCDDVTNFAR